MISEANTHSRIIDGTSPTQSDEALSRKRTQSAIGQALEECQLCHKLAFLEQDHNHDTDLMRARICHSCNVRLGRFDRPLAEIQAILDYLAYWSREHAAHGGRSYTAWMREAFPKFKHSRHGIPKTSDQRRSA